MHAAQLRHSEELVRRLQARIPTFVRGQLCIPLHAHCRSCSAQFPTDLVLEPSPLVGGARRVMPSSPDARARVVPMIRRPHVWDDACSSRGTLPHEKEIVVRNSAGVVVVHRG